MKISKKQAEEQGIDLDEATRWIEGLDRIHKTRRIQRCFDLSAAPPPRPLQFDLASFPPVTLVVCRKVQGGRPLSWRSMTGSTTVAPPWPRMWNPVPAGRPS